MSLQSKKGPHTQINIITPQLGNKPPSTFRDTAIAEWKSAQKIYL